jgi:hypothetical protein
MEAVPTSNSRLLNAAERKNQARQERQLRAVSFRKLEEGEKRDV